MTVRNRTNSPIMMPDGTIIPVANDAVDICIDQLDGDDANDGSAEHPVRTSERANELIPEAYRKGCRIHFKYNPFASNEELRAARKRGEL